jgi:heme/copper-type cytochrome/quinol oxidase subunit 2
MIKLTSLIKTALAEYDARKGAQDLANSPNSIIKSADQIWGALTKIVQYTYTIFFIVAIFFILIAAFNFLTSKGDPEKVKSARSQILWAVVAIAIALVSSGAALIIQGFIGK